MTDLQLFNLELVDQIISPELFEKTTLSSSALTIFTDFKDHKASVIEGGTLATDVLNLMLKEHVRMKIVISPENDFLGIISANELSEQNIITEVSKGAARNEILVNDLMLPRHTLSAFDYDELVNAKVEHVVHALQNYGLLHCLVVDRNHHHIRGVISASDIARKLHLPIEIDLATSFSRIFEIIHAQ
jgi:CBS domain containing-hemolysin-like protein